MMPFTRGNLVPALIYELDDMGLPKFDGIKVVCMFNPYEYKISKSNNFQDIPEGDSSTSKVDYTQSNPVTLDLSLIFDTSEMLQTAVTGGPVNRYTDLLFKMMEVKSKSIVNSSDRKTPPTVAFQWGMFLFRAVITSVSQQFTLFKPDGTPLRAKVDISFKSNEDPTKFPFQNPTSGDGFIQKTWRIKAGDRLDTIAYELYGDAAQWRRIAECNHIRNPLSLSPGQYLAIPLSQETKR